MYILKASLLILALFVCALPAHAQAKSGIKQESQVDFPGLGKVSVQVIEAGASHQVIFMSVTSGKIVALFPPAGRSRGVHWPTFKAGMNEAMSFKVARLAGVWSPLIFVSRVYRGGDYCGFKTDVVGEVAGKLRLLTNSPFETDDMGGMHAGDLGAQVAQGPVAQGLAVWSFIWGADEAHFDHHRYKFELYKYDARKALFVKTKVLSSRQKYERGEEAAKELKLPYQKLLSSCGDLFDDETYHVNRKKR
jgi:hypothetical protein